MLFWIGLFFGSILSITSVTFYRFAVGETEFPLAPVTTWQFYSFLAVLIFVIFLPTHRAEKLQKKLQEAEDQLHVVRSFRDGFLSQAKVVEIVRSVLEVKAVELQEEYKKSIRFQTSELPPEVVSLAHDEEKLYGIYEREKEKIKELVDKRKRDLWDLVRVADFSQRFFGYTIIQKVSSYKDLLP